MLGQMSHEMLAELRGEAIDLVENLASLCAGLHVTMQHGSEVAGESVGELFRLLHTLKGLSQMAGLGRIVAALHQVEDFVAAVRDGARTFGRDDLDLLNDLQDALEKFYHALPLSAESSLVVVVEQVGACYSVRSRGERLPDEPSPVEESAAAQAPAENAPPSVDSAEPTESQVALESEDSEDAFEATADERAAVEKFRARDENLFASMYPPGTHSDTDSLWESESVENIRRVADVLCLRVCEAGSLVVFAAELEEDMLDSIAANPVTRLPKDAEPCGVLPEPWCAFYFGVDLEGNASNPAGSAVDAVSSEDEPAKGTRPPDAPETSRLASASAHGVAHGVAHDVAHDAAHDAATAGDSGAAMEFEDFDGPNLGPSAGKDALPDLDPEMLQDFLSNVDELIEQLAQAMLAIEANSEDKDAIDLIFRAAHTIKGTSGMFGFRAIERLCHVMENLFDRIRKGSFSINTPMVDALFQGLDRVKAMFESVKKGASSELPINEALAALKAAEAGVSLGAKGRASPASSGAASVSNEAPSPVAAPLAPTAGPSTSMAQAPLVAPTQSAAGAGGAAGGANKPKDGKAGPTAGEGVGTIRVDLKRLDSLVNLVGELVIDRSRFARIEEELRAHDPGSELCNLMSESVLLFSRHMNEVQSIIMKVRMVPVGNAFYKFTRVVRDLSKQVEKEIDLVIEGGETELDKTLVEEIGDPLVHLIRNSVDHGVEAPDAREAAGKPRKGTILLKAAQDGNMIVITVRDDGKGLQTERIRNKAIQAGLIKESDQLSDKEIFNLIFEAGFSTADQVTNISGRGVGMDVVKKNIIKLKGIIELDSRIGKGTTTTIKLPLTLAIIPSLMVGVGGESYAIPLVNVVETIRMDPDEVQRVGASEFVKLRDQVIPLMPLKAALEMQDIEERFWYRTETSREGSSSRGSSRGYSRGPRSRNTRPRMIFVVVGVGEKRVGVVVDELLGQQEIVIKSLGRLMGRLRGVAGGCVLGNGRVALVLDAGEMIDVASFKKSSHAPGVGASGGHARAS
jgi:two-component system chemotaxis sensor kinase CheA